MSQARDRESFNVFDFVLKGVKTSAPQPISNGKKNGTVSETSSSGEDSDGK